MGLCRIGFQGLGRDDNPVSERAVVRHVYPAGNPGANTKSISYGCHRIMVAFVLELAEETIYLPLGCLQGDYTHTRARLRDVLVYIE